jgi:hypothetical protein
MTPRTEREIDTEKIERIVSAAANSADRSERNDRISNLETEVNTIKENLHEGSIQFVKLGNAIDNLSSTLGTIKAGFLWFLGVSLTLVLGFCGSMLWFLIKLYALKDGAA